MLNPNITLDYLAKYVSMKVHDSWLSCFSIVKEEYDDKWLKKIDFEGIMDFYQFDDRLKDNVYSELEKINTDIYLNFICFLWYYILFIGDDYENIWSWERSQTLFSEHGSYMMSVVCLLCGYPFHLASMKRNHYDSEQIKLQKKAIYTQCLIDYKLLGIEGMKFNHMLWGSFFMKGYLIEINRLQFEYVPGDKMVSIHIPRGKSLLRQDVINSINQARKQIGTFFPELRNYELVCESWLLSLELKMFLKEDSNILLFQELFTIKRSRDGLQDILEFVFNTSKEGANISLLPQETSLQRKLKDYLSKGGKLSLGMGKYKEDLN